MGNVDIVTKNYMRDAEVFADAFNYFIYGGRQVIDPAQLSPLDPVELGMMSENAENIGTGDLIQKYRDLLKLASLMMDESAVYLLLGIENQTNVNYAMPVKNMSYDAQQYAGQVAAIARRHRREEGHNKRRGEAFLSGFYKEDRLVPVITLVIFFGPGRWDGPLSLHEMMDVKDPGILSLVQDYKIHLIEPAALEPADFAKFHSSLREVLSFIKYSKDKTKILELMRTNERFQELDREAALVVRTCTNINVKIKKRKRW